MTASGRQRADPDAGRLSDFTPEIRGLDTKVQRAVNANRDDYASKLQFVFVQDGKRTADKNLQTHIQRETFRKRRWDNSKRVLEMRKAASASFKESFSTTKIALPPKSQQHPTASALPRPNNTKLPSESRDDVYDDLGELAWDPDDVVPSAYYEEPIVPLSPRTLLGAGRTNPFRNFVIDVPNLDRYIDSCAFIFVNFGL
jgi:hypothetical protein